MTADEIEAVVSRAVSETLDKLGIDANDHKEMQADFLHLRRWRKSVEQAQSYTFKTIITVISTGFIGVVWLGIKTTLGK